MSYNIQIHSQIGIHLGFVNGLDLDIIFDARNRFLGTQNILFDTKIMLVCVIWRKRWTWDMHQCVIFAYSSHFGSHLGFQGQKPRTKNGILSNLKVYIMSFPKMYGFIFIQRNPTEAPFHWQDLIYNHAIFLRKFTFMWVFPSPENIQREV